MAGLALLALAFADARATVNVAARDSQPLAILVTDLLERMDAYGIGFPEATREQLEQVLLDPDAEAGQRIQQILDPHCVMKVRIPEDGALEAAAGDRHLRGAKDVMFQGLVKFHNPGGVIARPDVQSSAPWLDVWFESGHPWPDELHGVEVEYRLMFCLARRTGSGNPTVQVGLDAAGSDRDAQTHLPTQISQSRVVSLDLKSGAGNPTTLALIIRDSGGNLHPPPLSRTEPDFHFQPQVYRQDTENITLPDDTYTVTWSRGPQSVPQSDTFIVSAGVASFALQATRWVDLRDDHGIYSGDHHIHAAGCSHFSTPTCGVTPATMVRHCEGEDLNFGLSLVWQGGGCWDHQLGFFLGGEDPASSAHHRLTTGVELSGFSIPTSINGWGHAMPLGIESVLSPTLGGWPDRSISVFEWAKRDSENVVTGYAHSGAGMEPREAAERDRLPHHGTPRADNIGANGFLAADVALDVVLRGETGVSPTDPPGQGIVRERAVDILGVGENPFSWDLTPWYHALNCGFQTRIAGETDFPCASDEHVGDVRSYVKLGDGTPPTSAFLADLEHGKSYVTGSADPAGEVHYLQFVVRQANDGSNVARLFSDPELRLPGPMKVDVSAKVMAYLDPNGTGNSTPLDQPPYWDPERARLPGTRDLDVVLVMNGQEIVRRTLRADGVKRSLNFGRVKIDHGSWLALRSHSSSHTNPIFVTIAGAPIRASQRSADWFLRKAIPAAGTHVLTRMAVWQAPVSEINAAVDSITRCIDTFLAIEAESEPDWPTGTLAGVSRPDPKRPGAPERPESTHAAAARSLLATVQAAGDLFEEPVRRRLRTLLTADSPDLAAADRILGQHVWYRVEINPESRVRVLSGPKTRNLINGDAGRALVRVHNQAGVRSRLHLECEQDWGDWLLLPHRDHGADLGGFELEYRLVQVTPTRAGGLAARVGFHVGSGTRDLGLRDRVTAVFRVEGH